MRSYLLSRLASARMNRQSGFTLIELIVIGAILVILAAISIPAYQNYIAQTTNARNNYSSEVKKNCSNLTAALTGVSGFSNAITNCP